jgi:hypothetical protein
MGGLRELIITLYKYAVLPYFHMGRVGSAVQCLVVRRVLSNHSF